MLILFSIPSQAQDHSQLQQLLSPFSGIPHIKLAYQEKRFSIFFKQPRLYQGTIEYISPDTLIKSVETPDRKKFVLQQNTLSIYEHNIEPDDTSDPINKVSLDDYPQLKQLKTLFIALFQGDTDQLVKFYQYKIHHLANNTTRLVLKSLLNNPLIDDIPSSLSKQQIDIVFQHQRIIKILMKGLGGERSEVIFNYE
ncbi:hypothetical protein [sulfur-oxidizing endosymbiont of Gigantopelta aegis]|uniref:hypothetical protein n=1 Tax=sulfur-oxidizing endosymbiont of Gigantopelta aegis TaxID=2794934 RepID=UPI001BE47A87|nr:hypothetical protein [sulfur-oxidizing endosymbiont of Gigantopelta aegis]